MSHDIPRPSLSGGRLPNAAIATGYALLLVLITARLIAEPFRYLGFDDRPWSSLDLALWVGSTCVLGLINYVRWTRPSQVAFTFLLATVAVPVVSIPVFWGSLTSWGLFVLQVMTIASFLVIRFCLAGEPRPLGGVKLPTPVFWLFLVTGIVGGIGYLIVSTGLSPGFLSLSDVYAQRDEYSESISSVGAYLVGWIGAGILPMLLAVGMYRRHPAVTAFAAGSVVLLYSITGHKSYLVGIGLTVAAVWLCQPQRRRGNSWFVTLGAIAGIAAILDLAMSGYAFSTLLVRRALATAGLNTGLYVDFFSQHDRYGLQHTAVGSLLPGGAPPYQTTPARLIGLEYYGSLDTAANANFIADGYANFGVWGALMMAAAIGIFLRTFDRAAFHLPLQVSAPALALVIVALANTAALTVLTTHGGLIALVLALAIPVVAVRDKPGAGSTGHSLGRPAGTGTAQGHEP